ncbi:unnamed protein product [Microthlaspi erraticum]|uniref:Uncharacterized protein n=1 Tax=Microthlaspi erraticum TaxID=1685480 RepID=A0A6D2JKH4_9BRAS|nr:unnamed protein product [Microthlaspi erraticum]
MVAHQRVFGALKAPCSVKMVYEEDEVNEFPISEVDWGEESNHSWGGEEGHDQEQWGDLTDSEISFGDEVDGEDFETEPPGYGQGSRSHESWSSEEDYIEDYEEENHESNSQFSPEEGDHEIESEHEQLSHEDQFVEPYFESEPEYGESIHGREPWSQDTGTEASNDGDSELEEEPELEYTNQQSYGEDDETDYQISL